MVHEVKQSLCLHFLDAAKEVFLPTNIGRTIERGTAMRARILLKN